MHNSLGKLLTSQQVARTAGKTRATVCLAVKEKRLEPAMKLPGINGAYLFHPDAVSQWLGLPAPLFEFNES